MTELPTALKTKNLHNAFSLDHDRDNPGNSLPPDVMGYSVMNSATLLTPLRDLGYGRPLHTIYRKRVSGPNGNQHPLSKINSIVYDLYNPNAFTPDVTGKYKALIEDLRRVTPVNPDEPSETRIYLELEKAELESWKLSERRQQEITAIKLSKIISRNELWIVGIEPGQPMEPKDCTFQTAPLRGLVAATQRDRTALIPIVQGRDGQVGILPEELYVSDGVCAPIDI